MSSPATGSPSTTDASTPDGSTPADGTPAGSAPVGVGAAAASQAPSSATTSTPDADSSAFEAAVAADAAAADAAAATDTPDASSPDASTLEADATDDPDTIDADDAMAAGAIAAGAVGVVGLHAGASGGKAPTAPSSSTSASAPGSSSAPAAAGTPEANSPDAETPDAETPDADTPDADTPDADTLEADTPDPAQPDTGTNTTDRTTAEIDAALAAINPNFDPFDPTNGYATNCGNTSSILNDFLNGNPSREAPTGTLTVPEMEALTGNPQTPMTPDQIADSLRGMGAGSHCVVGIDRSTGDGHWFNAYFDGTTVWSIDAQTGTRSPWPPNEPNATVWDASIRPEDVADPKTPDTDVQSGDASSSGGSIPADGSSAPATPDSDPSTPDVADAIARDGESPASRGAAPDAADPRPRIPEYSVEFTPNIDHDRVEFERQLDLQETGLNELSIAEFLANREAYLERAENGETGRDPAAAALQQEARDIAISDWTAARTDELMASGLDFEEAYDRADREANVWAATQAALHSPDQVAGGFADRITGLGDLRVNSSIGAQWKYRIATLEAAVRAASEGMTPQELSNTLLNIRLTIAS
ncbi:hypothetical protein ELQ90_04035 [Labedella phragmitis]|uniref:Tox-PL domain-containing protein n=1 Tax=Labedella phragmitis TaxID=2498849 RepID=A0A3S3Z6W2_9MICO|nr:polymorphic toxin type 15 domain-containing protein [Labedella phragmitis]RWZ53101.1 hypothetical protein ELQ90_04035 [Labedella phragmitis]